ncbi:hypothetical protein MKW94_004863, partial [Papaver nudicaule]|nr:hypothetical protein [Papaver nudicaule]
MKLNTYNPVRSRVVMVLDYYAAQLRPISTVNMALSIVQDFPNLVMMISPVHEMCGLELLVQRPFAFRSGANKMRWWRKFIYSLIQVDMTSAYVDYTCLCATCTKRDEENTIESSECTKAKESLLSKNLTPYLIL